MIEAQIAIHDIEDVEGFVKASIVKTRLKITNHHEREELVCEGIAILMDLAKKYKPQMAGYDKPGSFAGYCSIYLPKKIATAWHKMHPEHLLETTTLENGKVVKRYVYGEAPASLEEQIERDESVDSDRIRCLGNFVQTR